MVEPSGPGQFSGENQRLVTDLQQLKIISYGIIAIIAFFVGFTFRKKLEQRDSLHSLIEYAFILNIIPVLSPLAWKFYSLPIF